MTTKKDQRLSKARRAQRFLRAHDAHGSHNGEGHNQLFDLAGMGYCGVVLLLLGALP